MRCRSKASPAVAAPSSGCADRIFSDVKPCPPHGDSPGHPCAFCGAGWGGAHRGRPRRARAGDGPRVVFVHGSIAAAAAVRSLTVSEPGSLGVARSDPAVDLMIVQGTELFCRRDEIACRDFVALFRAGAHSARSTPEVLPDWLERGARLAMAERTWWGGGVAVGALGGAASC